MRYWPTLTVACALLPVTGTQAYAQNGPNIDPNAIVRVTVANCVKSGNVTAPAMGTGTLVSDSGHVLTAYHLLNRCRNSPITLISPRWSSKAVLIDADEKRDLAVIMALNPPRNVRPVPMTDDLQQGDAWVPRYSYPARSYQFSTRRRVERVDVNKTPMDLNCGSNERPKTCWGTPPVPAGTIDFTANNGDSGAPVIQNDSLVGIVILKKADGMSLAVGNIRYSRIVNPFDSTPQQSLLDLEIDPEIEQAQVRLLSWNPWMEALDTITCAPVAPMIESLRQSENASWPEIADNSDGSPIRSVGPALGAQRLSDDVLAQAQKVEGEAACGAFRKDAALLIDALLRARTLARRLGTLRTLWAASDMSLVYPWTKRAERRWKNYGGVWLNPIEVLLAKAMSPDLEKAFAIKVKDTDRASVCTALKDSALLAGGVRPPNGLLATGVSCDAVFNAGYDQAISGLDPSMAWSGLAFDLKTQAKFWNQLMSSRLLDSTLVVAYASGTEQDVIAERDKLLSAVPMLGLSSSIKAVANTIAPPTAQVHEALALAQKIEAAYGALPNDVVTATSLRGLLSTFTSPNILPYAFNAARTKHRSDFSVKLDALGALALDLDRALALAIIELLQGKVTRQTPGP